jgi:HAD superfamily phosphoserine phosphatase-like hydrolase
MKIIFLDLEGSLMEHKSVWRELNRIFGFTEEEEYNYYRQMIAAEEGKYTDWIKIVSDKWREKSPRKSFFEKFFNYKMKFKPRAKEFVNDLKNGGFKTVLISYAPEILVKKAAEYLGVDDYVVFHELVFDEKGLLKGILLKSNPDKMAVVSEYISKSKLKREDTFALGDSVTDIKMLKCVGKGFWMGDFPVMGVLAVSSFDEILDNLKA